MFHLILFPVIVLFVLFAVVFRVLSWPSRYHRHRYGHRHGWGVNRWGGDGYRNPYAPGLFTILAFVALERLFGRRYY
jgi:hypothetical protein